MRKNKILSLKRYNYLLRENKILKSKNLKITLGENKPYTWHKPFSIKDNSGWNIISCKEMITGCGIMQLYGISNINKIGTELSAGVISLQYFEKQIQNLIASGAGLLVCTLGKTFYLREKLLFQLGFIQLIEYNNWKHGSNYKQKLYAYKLK